MGASGCGSGLAAATADSWLYPGDDLGGFFARKQVGNGWTGFAIVK